MDCRRSLPNRQPEEAPSAPPALKDIALDLLAGAYPNPLKARHVGTDAERIMGKKLHPKSPGMTLYRLAEAGLARREGHNWYWVPPEQRHQ